MFFPSKKIIHTVKTFIKGKNKENKHIYLKNRNKAQFSLLKD